MTDTPAIKQNANGIWHLDGEQLWDSDILPVCLDHIKEGDTVIDAGAWIGGHTMAYAKKVGVTGATYAFEANPLAFHCLAQNIETNVPLPCGRIIIRQVALGDEELIVPFSAKRGWYDSGHVGWASKDWIPDADTIAEVQMRTLDSYEIAPNFIKIDVEGCELKVLKGAAKTIEKHRPRMVVEINKPALERQGNTREQVFDWLHGHGYTYQPIDNYMNDIYNILAIP